jgi:hypothetical protein
MQFSEKLLVKIECVATFAQATTTAEKITRKSRKKFKSFKFSQRNKIIAHVANPKHQENKSSP